VADAVEADARLHSLPVLPDLILLDLIMPGGHGSKLREAQLKDPTLAKIPVVILSGAADLQAAAAAMKAAAWVGKPFQLETLLATVRRLAPTPLRESTAAASPRLSSAGG
jgi:CheY-like chemotaxis protein